MFSTYFIPCIKKDISTHVHNVRRVYQLLSIVHKNVSIAVVTNISVTYRNTNRLVIVYGGSAQFHKNFSNSQYSHKKAVSNLLLKSNKIQVPKKHIKTRCIV
jgi:hypothetical protein